MSLIGSMYVSRTGLVNIAKGISITSDNLSNLNTYGFKSNRPVFSDVFSKYVGIVSSPIGLGTQLQSVDTIYREGSINITDVPTDLAIHGKGFFMVYDEKSGKTYYTRNGMFHIEDYNENYVSLVNPSGFRLKGQQLNGYGTGVTGTGEIVIPKDLKGKETSYINMRFNLDATVDIETDETSKSLTDAWNPDNDPPISQTDYEWMLKVPYIDKQGQRKELVIYFDRTTENNQYEFIITQDKNLIGSGTIDFDESGLVSGINLGDGLELVSGADAKEIDPTLDVEDNAQLIKVTLGEGEQAQTIFLDWGLIDKDGEIVGDQSSITQLASPFVSLFQDQNGYTPGFLQDIYIDEEGIIHALYSNNQKLEVAQILLAGFSSDVVLSRAGQTLFEAPPGIQPAIFEPGNDAPASIVSGALESSNVDITQEMINLIAFQRSFQSNTKIITVSDQLLEDMVRMR